MESVKTWHVVSAVANAASRAANRSARLTHQMKDDVGLMANFLFSGVHRELADEWAERALGSTNDRMKLVTLTINRMLYLGATLQSVEWHDGIFTIRQLPQTAVSAIALFLLQDASGYLPTSEVGTRQFSCDGCGIDVPVEPTKRMPRRDKRRFCDSCKRGKVSHKLAQRKYDRSRRGEATTEPQRVG